MRKAIPLLAQHTGLPWWDSCMVGVWHECPYIHLWWHCWLLRSDKGRPQAGSGVLACALKAKKCAEAGFLKTAHQSALVPNWCHVPMVRPTQRWKTRSFPKFAQKCVYAAAPVHALAILDMLRFSMPPQVGVCSFALLQFLKCLKYILKQHPFDYSALKQSQVWNHHILVFSLQNSCFLLPVCSTWSFVFPALAMSHAWYTACICFISQGTANAPRGRYNYHRQFIGKGAQRG